MFTLLWSAISNFYFLFSTVTQTVHCEHGILWLSPSCPELYFNDVLPVRAQQPHGQFSFMIGRDTRSLRLVSCKTRTKLIWRDQTTVWCYVHMSHHAKCKTQIQLVHAHVLLQHFGKVQVHLWFLVLSEKHCQRRFESRCCVSKPTFWWFMNVSMLMFHDVKTCNMIFLSCSIVASFSPRRHTGTHTHIYIYTYTHTLAAVAKRRRKRDHADTSHMQFLPKTPKFCQNRKKSKKLTAPPKNWHFWRKSAAKWPQNQIFHENRPQNVFDAASWLPEACPKVPRSLPEGSGKVHPVPRRSPKVPRRFVQNLGKLLNFFEIWHLWGFFVDRSANFTFFARFRPKCKFGAETFFVLFCSFVICAKTGF